MSKHPLTYEDLDALLKYDPNSGVLTWKVDRSGGCSAGDVAGSREPRWGHTRLWIAGRRYMAHRVAWMLTYKKWPNDMIDHINGNPSDNRIENLRESNNRHNQQNIREAQINSSHGFLGVTRMSAKSGRWRARIMTENGRVNLGAFDTPEAAHQAYLQAKRLYHDGCTI